MAEHGRLIDADALMAEMHNIILEDGEDRRTFYEVIERQPTIEPERKTGKWIDGKLDWHGIAMERYCSECGQLLTSAKTVYMNYCPNCGADMRGEQDG